VPTSCIPWPTQGLRRISVNSFGFGGANSHIILDDALHAVEALGLVVNHRTLASAGLLTRAPEKLTNRTGTNGADRLNGVNHHADPETRATSKEVAPGYRLLTWSARDEAALKRMLHLYDGFIKAQMHCDATFLGDLAYTLAARRSLMTWRSFSVVDVEAAPETLNISAMKCERAARENGVAFIFTGQGAQYANMGMELLRYPIFRATLAEADAIFQELGAEWSLFGKYSILPVVQ
jgi:acyl transferase domain-containing protein